MKKLFIFLITVILYISCVQPFETTENDYNFIVEEIKQNYFYNHNSKKFKKDCMDFIINEKEFLINNINPIYQTNPRASHLDARRKLKKKLGREYESTMKAFAVKYNRYQKRKKCRVHKVEYWIDYYYKALKSVMHEKESSN